MSSKQDPTPAKSEISEEQLEQVSGGWPVEWAQTAPAPKTSNNEFVIKKVTDVSSSQ
jgi:bacteriocin-like protein